MKKYEKLIHISFWIISLIFVCVFLFMSFFIKDDVYDARVYQGFELFVPEAFQSVPDSAQPCGIRNELYFPISNIEDGNDDIVFYTIHQNVEVYIDNELIYSLKPDESNLFSKTPGNNWNFITLYAHDEGKQLKVVITPVYESVADTTPDFYIGSKLSIWLNIIRQGAFAFILAVVAMVIGLIFIIFSTVTMHSKTADRSVLMMGTFAIQIGLWKFSDLSLTSLIFPH